MEKQYMDFVNEISGDELYKGLLAFGLFSEKLPPVFTAERFYDYCQINGVTFQGDAHSYVYYENMRNINVPRPLAIPNPMAYQKLCLFLRDNWSNIKMHFNSKTHSQHFCVSRIHIRKMHMCPELFQMNYNNWRVDGSPEVEISFGRKYMVKADISSCFPSIYTHALSWALATKEVAKNTRNDRSQWYNKIDQFTRRMTNDETHGLLIGPHATNLLSEIILTTIDKQLENWQYIRAIDDYTCYVDTYEDGLRFLAELGSVLRSFDLSLNHRKTEILELPLAATEHWQRRLSSLPLKTDYRKMDYILVRSYLDHAIEIMHACKENSAILKYAVKVISGQELTHNAKEYFVKTILSLSVLYPYLVTTLDEFVFGKFCIECQNDHGCIRKYSEKIYKIGYETNNYELAAYAVFFAIKYRFQSNEFIEELYVEKAVKSEDCVLLLLLSLYAKENHVTEITKRLKQYARTKRDIETFDRLWLFLYEILPQSDLRGDWKPLKKADISFIKPVSQW